eukprot:58028-Prymnesium_polylepis.2
MKTWTNIYHSASLHIKLNDKTFHRHVDGAISLTLTRYLFTCSAVQSAEVHAPSKRYKRLVHLYRLHWLRPTISYEIRCGTHIGPTGAVSASRRSRFRELRCISPFAVRARNAIRARGGSQSSVALPEQERSSCPLTAHTRVSIPRSVELGDPPVPDRVVVLGSRGRNSTAIRIANFGEIQGDHTR